MNYTYKYPSPIGLLTLASDGEAIIGLWIEGQKYFADTLGEEHGECDLPVFERAREWLDIYFSGREPQFSLPISMKASPFRLKVWEILKEIPYGKTVTYGEIAKRIEKESGKRASAQAVGGAVGHNPISIIVPCHRVMGAGGDLTGYAGGIDLKLRLLELEGVDTACFRTGERK